MQCNVRKIQTQKVKGTTCSVPNSDQPISSADLNHKQQLSQPSTSASQQCKTQGTPAYLAKKRKEVITSKKISLTSTVIIDDNAVETIDNVTPVVALHGINLLTSDIALLESQHGWLNQKLINVGQKMLQAKFPETEGLNDVGCSDTLTYSGKATTNFVQILNVDRSHWVCVSTKFSPPSTVNVFDSSYQKGKSLTFSTKEAIAAMIKSHDKVIKLHFPAVQQQPDTSSCGLFALANAYTLCEGKDPVSINYDVNNMRSHFLTCIYNMEFNAFPSTKFKSSLSTTSTCVETFTIHCICRLPDDGTGMICCDKCKEKYHTICIGLNAELKQKTWYCVNCM